MLESAMQVVPYHKLSDRYGMVHSDKVIEVLLGEGWEVVSERETKSRSDHKGFQRHMITFRNPALPLYHECEIHIHLINSHDGTSRCHLGIGAYRLACMNGMIFGTMFGGFIIRHGVNIVKGVPEWTNKIPVEALKFARIAEDMEGVALDAEDRYLFAKQALSLRFPDKNTGDTTIDSGFQMNVFLEPRRAEDTNRNLWGLYNICQEKLMRGGDYAMFIGKQKTITCVRPLRNIRQIVNINIGLWELATVYLNSRRRQSCL